MSISICQVETKIICQLKTDEFDVKSEKCQTDNEKYYLWSEKFPKHNVVIGLW